MSELVLPGVSDLGLSLPVTLSYDEWAQVGDRVATLGRAVQWIIGDWLLFGETAYGEAFSQEIKKLTDSGEYREKTLMNYQYIAKAYPPPTRRAGLSWTVHAELVAFPHAERERILDRAQAEGWNPDKARTFRREFRRAMGELPATEPERCQQCHLTLPEIKAALKQSVTS